MQCSSFVERSDAHDLFRYLNYLLMARIKNEGLGESCPEVRRKDMDLLHSGLRPWHFTGVNVCSGVSWLSGSMRDVQARDRGFDPQLRWICSNVVLLGKALCSHVHSLDPGVIGYLVGQWRLVCLNSSVHRKMAAGAVCSPGSWDGLWTSRSYDQGVIVWSQASGAWR